jgi:hypothetical protein
MRTLRLSLVGTVILVLLGGISLVTLAQDDGDGIAATHVTGTMVGVERLKASGSNTSADDFSHMTGYGAVAERDMEWSDPRLPSLMRVSANWDRYGVVERDGVGAAFSQVQSIRLDGSDGAWTGTVYGLLEETTQSETYPQTVLMVLEGEGAYEGLSAMLRSTYEEPPAFPGIADWEGYIFEGPMTPIPEPPAE